MYLSIVEEQSCGESSTKPVLSEQRPRWKHPQHHLCFFSSEEGTAVAQEWARNRIREEKGSTARPLRNPRGWLIVIYTKIFRRLDELATWQTQQSGRIVFLKLSRGICRTNYFCLYSTPLHVPTPTHSPVLDFSLFF